jgi:hypothetical protein
MGALTTLECAIPASSATPPGGSGAAGRADRRARHLGPSPVYDVTLRADTVDLSWIDMNRQRQLDRLSIAAAVKRREVLDYRKADWRGIF